MLSFRAFPNKGQIIVFEHKEKIVGYSIIVWIWTNEFGSDVLWIDEIVVDKNYRGYGIGQTFFLWLETTYSSAPALSLLVAENNEKAKKFYSQIGFKPIQKQMLKVNNLIRMDIKEAKELAAVN